MIFTRPVPFSAAIESRRVKTILPTEASSAQLMNVEAELRERAMFSARVNNARLLGKVDEMIGKILETEGLAPGQAIDPGTFRLEMTKALRATKYQPSAEDKGTIKDLFSGLRQDLIRETNVRMAQGYGYWQQGQSTAVLDAFPAQELFRAEARNVQRDWIARWQSAGGTIYTGSRMIAPKNHPIWVSISVFGLPYAPFDFNSGMDVRDIGRTEAIALGVIEEGTAIQPETRRFNEDLEVSAETRSKALHEALLASLGDSVQLINGVLQLK